MQWYTCMVGGHAGGVVYNVGTALWTKGTLPMSTTQSELNTCLWRSTLIYMWQKTALKLATPPHVHQHPWHHCMSSVLLAFPCASTASDNRWGEKAWVRGYCLSWWIPSCASFGLALDCLVNCVKLWWQLYCCCYRNREDACSDQARQWDPSGDICPGSEFVVKSIIKSLSL